MSKETEDRLNEMAKKVNKLKGFSTVVEFLDAFMDDERSHIDDFLGKDNFNIRNASVCAEAYSTAFLLKKLITGDEPVA